MARSELADLRERLVEAELRLQGIQGSTSFRLAQLISSPAGSPRTIGRLLRDRSHARKRKRASAATASGETYSWLQLTKVALSAAPTRPRVLTIVARDTYWALEPSTSVMDLEPRTAQAVIDTVEADILLVEAAAGDPGERWAGLGTPAGAANTRDALASIATARDKLIPVVFWWNTPAYQAPALTMLAKAADLVVGSSRLGGTSPGELYWDVGVQLSEFTPTQANRTRGLVCVAEDSEPPWEGLEELLSQGVELHLIRSRHPARGWHGHPSIGSTGSLRSRCDVYRSAGAVLLRSQPDRYGQRRDLWEILAAGARPIFIDDAGTDDAPFVECFEPGKTPPPALSPSELVTVGRDLILRESVESRLSWLLNAAQARRPANPWSVSVFTPTIWPTGEALRRWTTAQSLPPDAVLLERSIGDRTARSGCAPVLRVPEFADPAAWAATHTTSRLLVTLDGPHGPNAIADAVATFTWNEESPNLGTSVVDLEFLRGRRWPNETLRSGR